MQQDPAKSTIVRVRREITELCLGVPDAQLENFFKSDAGAHYRALLQRLVIEVPSQKQERIAGTKLRKRLARSKNEVDKLGLLMATMLYFRSYDLPVLPDPRSIPTWFLDVFLQYMTNPVLLFDEGGEEDRYFEYMMKWIRHLHANICIDAPSPFWKRVADVFMEISDFGPLYFNERNLKELYVMRGNIIEQVLRSRGCHIDYSFPARAGTTEEPIRIGILANHFLPHPETFATLPVYEFLGPEYKVILYTMNPAGSGTQQYCSSRADKLVTLPQGLAEQAQAIRRDCLDILFIASNITAVINPVCLLSAHRLARIQVAGVGSVTTTGLRNVDYYLTGRLTDEEKNAAQYRERLAWLPGPAHCFSFQEQSTEKPGPITRKELGIPTEAVVYVSGANVFKILPQLIEAWARILKELPNALLMLYPYGPNWSANYPKHEFVARVQSIFARHKIAPERLVVLDPQPVPSRLQIREYVRLGDIYLDSFPFSGTTTLIDPLSLGLPVITKTSGTFRGAMGSGLLQSLGMQQLVGADINRYINIAVELGRDSVRRNQLGAEITTRMTEVPDFLDSRRYSETTGAILRQLLAHRGAPNMP